MAARYGVARCARSRLRGVVSLLGSVSVKCHQCRAFGIEPPRSTTPKGVSEQGGVKRSPRTPPLSRTLAHPRTPPLSCPHPPSHTLAHPRTPSVAPCALIATVARRRVSLPLPSFGRCAAPRSLVGRLLLPVATALFPGAPAARLRPACFTARLGRAVALGN